MEDQFSGLEGRLDALYRLLESEFMERKAERNRERWLDAATTKFMLNKQDKTLYNYVRKGWITCKKLGGVNVYLESSILSFLERCRPTKI